MACNKWEETGLLFSSNELTPSEKTGFEEHLKACDECMDEYNAYTLMKRQYFLQDVLGAQPSAACDAEILRVCSDNRKNITSVGSFSLIFKKTLISLSLFVFGFVGVSYVSIKMNDNSGKQATIVAESNIVSPVDSMNKKTADSLEDSNVANGVNFAKTRGNLGLKGVVPVDLENK